MHAERARTAGQSAWARCLVSAAPARASRDRPDRYRENAAEMTISSRPLFNSIVGISFLRSIAPGVD
jgi:hypothetical protein